MRKISLNVILGSILLIAFLLITIFNFFIHVYFIIPKFVNLENQINIEKEYVIKKIIEGKLETLKAVTKDNSNWDAAYNFAKGENPNFIQTEFGDVPLKNMNLDYIYFYDKNQNLLWYDDTIKNKSPNFNSLENKKRIFSINQTTSTFYQLNESIIEMYAISPILNSAREGEIEGYLIFGNYIEKNEFEIELKSKTNYDLKLITYDENYDNNYYYSNYYDLDNKTPIFTIKLKKENNVDSIFSIFSINRIIFYILLLSIFVLFYLISKCLIINSIKKLSLHMNKIKDEQSYAPIKNDVEILEISNLYQSFNTMMKTIYEQEDIISDTTKKANTDALTKMYNRGFLIFNFNNLKEDSRVNNKSSSIIMIDVDYFKLYNDLYGHKKGDLVLIEIANILSNSVRTDYCDIAARYGGEEFVLFLNNISKKNTIKLIKRIQIKLHQTKIIHENSPISKYITLSIGFIHLKSIKNTDIINIMDKADKALYQVKNSGRNNFQEYEN